MRTIYVFFAILVAVACNKGGDDPGQAYRKFDTIQYYCGPSGTYIYKANYDQDKLVSLIGQGSLSRNYYFLYNSAGQLIQRDVEIPAGRQKLSEYKYNNSGQLVERIDLLGARPSANEYYKYTFTYTNGKLSETTAYKKSSTLPDYIFDAKRVYSWTGDNITLVKTYDQNNNPGLDSLKLTYDLTKPNPTRIFNKLWFQDIYDPPLTTIFLLSKNMMTSIFFTSFDCAVNYGLVNVSNESRVESIGAACLQTLWRFTY